MKVKAIEIIDLHEVFKRVDNPQMIKCRHCGRLLVVSAADVEKVRENVPAGRNNFLSVMREAKICCQSPRYKWQSLFYTLVVVEGDDKKESKS